MTVEPMKVVNPPAAPFSHSEIIKRKGGPAPFSRAIDEHRETVKGWSRADSIPSSRWRRIVDAKLATYDELALAAEQRKAALARVGG